MNKLPVFAFRLSEAYGDGLMIVAAYTQEEAIEIASGVRGWEFSYKIPLLYYEGGPEIIAYHYYAE